MRALNINNNNTAFISSLTSPTFSRDTSLSPIPFSTDFQLKYTRTPWRKPLRLTRCRWCVEGDLGTVGAEHGVPAASDPEGVQAVRVQVTHHSAGAVHPVRHPPDTTVLAVLLGRGLARASDSGEKD